MTNPARIVTPAEADELVAELREPKPAAVSRNHRHNPAYLNYLHSSPRHFWKWDAKTWDWLPAHHPTSDIASAWVLWEEVQASGMAAHQEYSACLCKTMGLDGYKMRSTCGSLSALIPQLSPLTITAAWLEWKGVPVEICETTSLAADERRMEG